MQPPLITDETSPELGALEARLERFRALRNKFENLSKTPEGDVDVEVEARPSKLSVQQVPLGLPSFSAALSRCETCDMVVIPSQLWVCNETAVWHKECLECSKYNLYSDGAQTEVQEELDELEKETIQLKKENDCISGKLKRFEKDNVELKREVERLRSPTANLEANSSNEVKEAEDADNVAAQNLHLEETISQLRQEITCQAQIEAIWLSKEKDYNEIIQHLQENNDQVFEVHKSFEIERLESISKKSQELDAVRTDMRNLKESPAPDHKQEQQPDDQSNKITQQPDHSSLLDQIQVLGAKLEGCEAKCVGTQCLRNFQSTLHKTGSPIDVVEEATEQRRESKETIDTLQKTVHQLREQLDNATENRDDAALVTKAIRRDSVISERRLSESALKLLRININGTPRTPTAPKVTRARKSRRSLPANLFYQPDAHPPGSPVAMLESKELVVTLKTQLNIEQKIKKQLQEEIKRLHDQIKILQTSSDHDISHPQDLSQSDTNDDEQKIAVTDSFPEIQPRQTQPDSTSSLNLSYGSFGSMSSTPTYSLPEMEPIMEESQSSHNTDFDSDLNTSPDTNSINHNPKTTSTETNADTNTKNTETNATTNTDTNADTNATNIDTNTTNTDTHTDTNTEANTRTDVDLTDTNTDSNLDGNINPNPSINIYPNLASNVDLNIDSNLDTNPDLNLDPKLDPNLNSNPDYALNSTKTHPNLDTGIDIFEETKEFKENDSQPNVSNVDFKPVFLSSSEESLGDLQLPPPPPRSRKNTREDLSPKGTPTREDAETPKGTATRESSKTWTLPLTPEMVEKIQNEEYVRQNVQNPNLSSGADSTSTQTSPATSAQTSATTSAPNSATTSSPFSTSTSNSVSEGYRFSQPTPTQILEQTPPGRSRSKESSPVLARSRPRSRSRSGSPHKSRNSNGVTSSPGNASRRGALTSGKSNSRKSPRTSPQLSPTPVRSSSVPTIDEETVFELDEIDMDQESVSLGEVEMAAEMLSKAQKQLPRLEGWLEKKSPHFLKGWQKRWVVLTEYNIFYGKSHVRVKTAQEAMNLGMNCISLMVVKSVKAKNPARQFEIIARDTRNGAMRRYMFRCPDQSERERWITGLSQHRDYLMSLLECSAISLKPLESEMMDSK